MKPEQSPLLTGLYLTRLRSTPQNLQSENVTKQNSPLNRYNKLSEDDKDMHISERRSTLLNKTTRSQKEELLSKRSGSNERNVVSQPYLDVSRRSTSMKRLFEEKEKD